MFSYLFFLLVKRIESTTVWSTKLVTYKTILTKKKTSAALYWISFVRPLYAQTGHCTSETALKFTMAIEQLSYLQKKKSYQIAWKALSISYDRIYSLCPRSHAYNKRYNRRNIGEEIGILIKRERPSRIRRLETTERKKEGGCSSERRSYRNKNGGKVQRSVASLYAI